MAPTVKYQHYGLDTLKLGLLLFWGLWFCLACLSNLADLFAASHVLPDSWTFRSGNFAQIVNVIGIYSLSPAVAVLLFIIDILLQAIIAALLLIATHKWWQGRSAWKWANSALLLSLALWATFILMDEFFIAYTYEATHFTLLISNLLTLFALQLLPGE